jgi:hypothetical protein
MRNTYVLELSGNNNDEIWMTTYNPVRSNSVIFNLANQINMYIFGYHCSNVLSNEFPAITNVETDTGITNIQGPRDDLTPGCRVIVHVDQRFRSVLQVHEYIW